MLQKIMKSSMEFGTPVHGTSQFFHDPVTAKRIM